MRLRLVAAIVAALLAVGTSAGAKSPPGAPACPVFPSDNVWHADVTKLPVHARSAAWIASMGGAARHLHPDFGDSGEAMPYGIPYTVVSSSHQKVSVQFQYAGESDPGPYPFGPDTPIEGGSDRHAIMIDKSTCALYELYAAHYSSGGSTAGSGAIWSLRSNKLRPSGWTSADAAGLPIFAGLVRLDEVKAGKVDHAIRVTASATDRSYLWPARHQAGAAHNANLPPMGARFRLKKGFSTSGFRSDTRVILTAMKRYGMIVADNGSDWFFTGTAENGWSNDMLDELKSIPAGAFEAADESSLMVDRNSGRIRSSGAVAVAPKPKPKPQTAVTPKHGTPKPSASPKPTQSATPTPTDSPRPATTPLASPADQNRGGRGWIILLAAGAGVLVAFVALIRRRSVRPRA